MNFMRITRCRRPSSDRASGGEDGFTLVEALVSVAVYSIVAAILFSGVTLGLRAVFKVSRTAKENAELLLLDDSLRRTASAIVIPFWERMPAASETSGEAGVSAAVGWYRGRKDGIVLIAGTADGFRAKTPDGETLLPGTWSSLTVSIFADATTSGLEASFTAGNGKSVRILAPFGGIPLASGRGGRRDSERTGE